MGAAFAEGTESRPPDLDRWTSVRASFPLPHGHARERTTAEASEACRSLSRPPRAIAEGEAAAAAAMPCSCSGMDMEWTLMNNCRDRAPDRPPLRRK